MGVLTLSKEVKVSVSASRMFKALVLDSHKILPKVLPQSINSLEYVEGSGGVGSITKTTFTEESKYKYSKIKTDALDTNNYECKYTMIDCDAFGDKIEKIAYEVKFEAAGDGCVVKETSHYFPKGSAVLNEEETKAEKEKAMIVYKAAEEFLLANPQVYA